MTTPPASPAIKLRALDAEDLSVVAACLQDAVVPIVEIAYLPEDQQFLMVVNRCKWETAGQDGVPLERTNCAVTVLGVTAVQRRAIDLLDRSLVLDLLTLVATATGIDLIFAGDSAIHLTAADWRCFVKDIGDPWPAIAVPRHEE